MTTVLVYSHDARVRDRVRLALGRSPAAGVDDVEYLMADEGGQVIRATDEELADLLVLDGEAWPTGGLGLCRELKNSELPCPPTIVLVGRRDDRWLGKWSQADVVLQHPVDPFELREAVVSLLGPGGEQQVSAAGGRQEEQA